MKIALISPWENAWVKHYKAAFEKRGHEFRWLKKAEAGEFDIALHGWTNDAPMHTARRNLMFLRRYELFNGALNRDWNSVDALICVNNWIKGIAESHLRNSGFKTPVYTIYNGTDVNLWKYRNRKPNKSVGMACHIHPKKNIPLALQILALLPEDYELHIAGELQDPCTAEYLNHVGRTLRRRIYLYGHIPSEDLDEWWEMMGVCLSTSLSEGNPNNVIEAMAKGIKPVVHYWPGAEDQFPDYLFCTAQEAANQILSKDYDSAAYRNLVQAKFSLSNIERVVDIALQEEMEHAWHPA